MLQGSRRSSRVFCQQVYGQVMERLAVEEALHESNPSGSHWVCWILPPPSVVKVYFDGAVWEDGTAAGACVVKDVAANLLLVAGCIWEHSSIFDVELKGAWEALKLARLHFSGVSLGGR